MWEDYYAILEADINDSFELLFDKYRDAVEKAVTKRNNGENVEAERILIDEASRMLFFDYSRKMYDEEYKKYIDAKNKHQKENEEVFVYELKNNPDLEYEISEAKRLAPTTVGDIEAVLSPPIKEIIKEGVKNTLNSFLNFFKNLTKRSK